MTKEIEGRLARLERYVGSFGVDIHEFDDADQADAHAKQLEADAKAEEKQARKETT